MLINKNNSLIESENHAPVSGDCFFGFHDISPWSPDNSRVVLLNAKRPLDRVPDATDEADIVVWTPATNNLEVIARTYAWNYQQAARQQWLPNGDIIFNDIQAGDAVARKYSPTTKQTHTYKLPIGDVSPTGEEAVTANYGRLRKYWKAYGYDVSQDSTCSDFAPENDGLWALNLNTGETRLMHSIGSIVKASGLSADRPHFLSHPSYSPDGKKIAFLHRFFSADVALYTRLLVCERDGSNLRELAKEKVSHFDWKDEENIMVWSRFAAGNIAALRANGYLNLPVIKTAVKFARKFKGRLKATLLSEHYYLMNVNSPSARYKVSPDKLTEDGHPMFSPKDTNLFVTDTYPKPNGNLSLMLVRSDTGDVTMLGEVRDGVQSSDSDIKCDLHPRWDRSGSAIGIDVCIEGQRRFGIVNLKPIISHPMKISRESA